MFLTSSAGDIPPPPEWTIFRLLLSPFVLPLPPCLRGDAADGCASSCRRGAVVPSPERERQPSPLLLVPRRFVVK